MSKKHHQQQSRCALCCEPLTETNIRKEHIIPNAIGGRKKVDNFICESCNSTTGQKWDKELCEQLKPFCTMLGIRRERKSNRPVIMRDSNNKEFTLNSDASISIPHVIRTKRALANKTEVTLEVKSMKEARRLLAQEVAARPNKSDLNVEDIMSNATSLQDQIQAPLRMSLPLFLSGEGAGRSIVKSCLGLAYQAGASVDDCDDARQFLEGTGDRCYGHYNATDLVENRPVGICFHCICVCGDPAQGHILAYVEYFGYQRMVARLSSNYHGDAFGICYAIDPVSGEKLDLDVALEFSQDDIPAILANKKVDQRKVEDCLKALLATCLKHLMITHAIESANAKCSVKSNQTLSEEHLVKWSNLVVDSLAPALLGLSPDHPLVTRDEQKDDEDLTS